jgi:hypothetical protein
MFNIDVEYIYIYIYIYIKGKIVTAELRCAVKNDTDLGVGCYSCASSNINGLSRASDS